MRIFTTRSKKNVFGGLFFALLGAVTLVLASRIQVRPNLIEPGGRLFPNIAGVGLILCGIGMALYREPWKEKSGNTGEMEKPFLNPDGLRRLIMFLSSLVLYFLGLKYLGFLISTPVASFAFISILKSERKASIAFSLILSIVLTGILYFGFNYGFNIYLPKGILFQGA
ncbi:MAG: tripartite tricarboxylate transporter TctB family protein [Spirochaetota bacterium]